jgi:DNA polymerase-3 subunit epsilon
MSDSFAQHCVVELMGHQKIAGLVTEQDMFGASLMRVDVPETSRQPAFTKFYGAAAIYAITPVEEAIAQVMAEALNEAPIQTWRLPDIKRLVVGYADDDDFPNLDDEPESEPDSGRCPHCGDPCPADGICPCEESGDDRCREDRRSAIAWARSFLQLPFVVLDIKTTGDGENDEIIQVGIVDQDGKVLLDQLVKPKQPITNAHLHGITDERVADAPTFSQVYTRLFSALDGKRLAGWNYDAISRMMTQMLARYSLKTITRGPASCAMQRFAQFFGDWDEKQVSYRWKGLHTALNFFDLEDSFGRDAFAHAKATLAVIKAMAAYLMYTDEELEAHLAYPEDRPAWAKDSTEKGPSCQFLWDDGGRVKCTRFADFLSDTWEYPGVDCTEEQRRRVRVLLEDYVYAPDKATKHDLMAYLKTLKPDAIQEAAPIAEVPS